MGKVIDMAVARVKRAAKWREETIKQLIKEAEALDDPPEEQEPKPSFISKILDIQARLLDEKDKDDE
jgi:hypothetical protein